MKDCFGFTEPELEKMASYFGMESTLDGIKEWYNGYIFGGDTVIYNPWSIVNYLSSPDEGLKTALDKHQRQQTRQGSHQTKAPGC